MTPEEYLKRPYHEVDYVLVDVKEYAFLKVLKSTMPPNASLVVCYDDGSGIPKIKDDLYPDYVLVRREDLEWVFSHTYMYGELWDRLKAALKMGQEISEPEDK